jgi:hypothetical protein
MKINMCIMPAILCFFPFLCGTDIVRVPNPHSPGLLVPGNAIPISQADFASGPLRISKAGYYYFTEDVTFNPDPVQEAKRKDKPLADEWFTALSVECDNVIIDLNTKTFATHQQFIDKQLLKVFSLIELSNMPFPNIKPEFAFRGIQNVIYAHNVTIKNGTLGASPHHGIHGNNNADIQMYDLVIRDWEVAGIALNGLKNGVIKNISISGMEHTFSFTGLVSVMLVARFLLEQRIAAGDSEAQQYLAPLNALIADPTRNGSIHPSGLNYGNTYGIFLNRAFDIGPVASSRSPLSTNAIVIENVRISNIKIDTLEAVVIGDAQGNSIAPDLFGSMRWDDAYPNGVFAPDGLLKAQVYILNKKNPAAMPAGFADNILSETPQESLFLSHARPVFNRDFPIHAQKGIFGIRVDAGHGVTIKNCSIMGLENVGKPGATLADIPAGSNYSFVPGRFTGNDIYGIALAVCDNCCVSNCDVSACSSKNGYIYGISLINQSDANHIEACKVSGLCGHRDDVSSPVNPSSKVYGFYLNNISNSNRLVDCVVQNVASPRSVQGIYVEACQDTMITNALCSNHRVTSDKNLMMEKRAAGIASIGCHGTAIRNSVVREISAVNEKSFGAAPSASRAIGYLLDGSGGMLPDQYGTIDHCIVECNDGGQGEAHGVYVGTVAHARVTDITSSFNLSKTNKGYGVYRTSRAQNIFVLRNTAYGNNKNYESGDASWPILALSSANVHSMNMYNSLYNISINS